MSFDLKSLSLSLADLQQAAEKDSTEKKNYKDERFWKPTMDDAGNSYAVIRFLPPAKGETVPWVKFWDFFFKGKNTNLWYAEKSLRSIGKTDPVGEYNRLQWADESGTVADVEARKAGVRNRKSRLNYIFNIYVVDDKNNPENNGKVFLYRTGATIYNMIKEALKPEFPDEAPIPVFDFLKGANFKVKVFTKDNNFASYEKSAFESPSPFLDGDVKKIEAVYNKIYPLQPLVAEDQFKSYDELKTKLYRTLGLDVDGVSVVGNKPAYEKPAGASKANTEGPPEDEEGDDDPLSYFKDLAEDD